MKIQNSKFKIQNSKFKEAGSSICNRFILLSCIKIMSIFVD